MKNCIPSVNLVLLLIKMQIAIFFYLTRHHVSKSIINCSDTMAVTAIKVRGFFYELRDFIYLPLP